MKETDPYSPRILVVDDEQAILDEFQNVLCPSADSGKAEADLKDKEAKLFGKSCPSSAAISFELVLCHQGDEAVEKVQVALQQKKPFAVVFLDVRMPPGPNGVWTAEHIRALDRYIHIVIVTAYSDVDPLDISYRVPPADKLLYIQKPFHAHEIRQCASALVEKWVGERKLRKQAIELARSNEQLKLEIAEHKQVEEKRQLLSHAIMSTDESIHITDMENKIIFVNEAFCETYGYKQEEVIGKDSNILWEESHQNANARKTCQAISGWEVGFYHKRKDGSEFPVSLSRSVISDENGKEIALVGVARDITERLFAEDKLRTTIQQLKKQKQLKSELAIAVADELRISLDALNNIIHELKANTQSKITPKTQINLEMAEKDTNRIRRIIRDFLDISKIDAGKIKMKTTKFSLQSLISEVIAALSPLAAEKRIALESSLPDSKLVVKADNNKIKQVLINLIEKATKLTPPNGHISIQAKDMGNEITVKVQHEAPSIESNEIDNILCPFAQIKKQVQHSGEDGLALALPIAKELVEMHNGHIWVEREDELRNNFYLTLPKEGIREEDSVVVKTE
ncbi:MAG: PAS domain S-box protein [Planctomycetota bacterium]|nr:MAG: PAS domain S-box protein [Planctomycetota bacterium]